MFISDASHSCRIKYCMRILRKTMAPTGNCISRKQTYWFIYDTHYLRRINIDSVMNIKDKSACISWEGDQNLECSDVSWNFVRNWISIVLDSSLHGERNGLDDLWRGMLCTRFYCLLLYLIQANQLGSNYCIRYCWLWLCLSVNLECKTVWSWLVDYLIYY